MVISERAAPRGAAVLDGSFVPKRPDRPVESSVEDPAHERYQQNDRPQNLTRHGIATVPDPKPRDQAEAHINAERRDNDCRLHHLTKHEKISDREPTATGYTASGWMANTPNVSRSLARGSLHRLVG